MTDLFAAAAQDIARRSAPLADRMRPREFDDFVGQDAIAGIESSLRKAIESDALSSIIFWGPPGTGKTTLAHLIATKTASVFVAFSAVTGGVKEAREIIAAARERLNYERRRTVLFIDEIHRFNKAQQDAFLPSVEDGTIILIGATTENPSFEINAALLSRCRVFVLESLSETALKTIVLRALADASNGLGDRALTIDNDALEILAASASGDARTALSNLEWVAACLPQPPDGAARLTSEHIRLSLPKKTLLYDKTGEEHYNLISALHKSVRGSDPQAALYWLARMLISGEDPMYLARRLVRMAIEDIGAADPQALPLAIAARDTYHFLGSPEGDLALAQIAVYLAVAPKSNTLYRALSAAKKAATQYGSLPVPLHIRNAPTQLMKDFGYGKNYKYAFDFDNAYAPQDYLPERLKELMQKDGSTPAFYTPGEFGFEKDIKKRMAWWDQLRQDIENGRRARKNNGAPLRE